MASLPREKLLLLQEFVQLCKVRPAVLNSPELTFYKEWLESLGAAVPVDESAPKHEHGCCGSESAQAGSCHRETKFEQEPAAHPNMEASSEESPESDLDIDDESILEPETDPLPELPPFDNNAEISDENLEKCDERKSEAMDAMNDGRVEDAIRLYTEAISLNPVLPVLFAKRAQLYLRLNRPNAAMQDANRALLLNPDSAPALKQRGRARRQLGKWEEAFNDLTLAQKIDYDDGTQETIKELQPKVKRIHDHKNKYERKRADREEKARRERLENARKAQEKARKEQESRRHTQKPGASSSGGMPGFEQMFSDPEIMAMMQDPEVAEAFKDISANPANIMKHQSNPKFAKVMEKLGAKLGGAGEDFEPDSGAFGSGSSPFGSGGGPFGSGGGPFGSGGNPFSSGGGGSGAQGYSTADVD